MRCFIHLTSTLAVLAFSSAAAGQPEGPPPRGDTRRDTRDEGAESRASERWMLAAEAATRAPVDIGAQATLETPIGLRLMGTYGAMPSAYTDILIGIAGAWTDSAVIDAVLDSLEVSGSVWRLGAGIRPIRGFGLYVDGGYARASLEGNLALSSTRIPELTGLGISGNVDSDVDMWFVEVGYQGQLFERAVLALGAGAMGAISSSTSVTASGIPESSTIASGLARARDVIDDAFETYGFVPTVTLRLGLDLI